MMVLSNYFNVVTDQYLGYKILVYRFECPCYQLRFVKSIQKVFLVTFIYRLKALNRESMSLLQCAERNISTYYIVFSTHRFVNQ